MDNYRSAHENSVQAVSDSRRNKMVEIESVKNVHSFGCPCARMTGFEEHQYEDHMLGHPSANPMVAGEGT